MHIFEVEVKDQIDPAVYQTQVGFLEMTLDVGAVREVMGRVRRR
jgi:betaine reductase